MKHGVYYWTRPLPEGGHGILISVWRHGLWRETDMNGLPWPSHRVAFERSRTHASNMALRLGLPVAPNGNVAFHNMEGTANT